MDLAHLDAKAARCHKHIVVRRPSVQGKAGTHDYFYRTSQAALADHRVQPNLAFSMKMGSTNTLYLALKTSENKKTYYRVQKREWGVLTEGTDQMHFQLVTPQTGELPAHISWSELSPSHRSHFQAEKVVLEASQAAPSPPPASKSAKVASTASTPQQAANPGILMQPLDLDAIEAAPLSSQRLSTASDESVTAQAADKALSSPPAGPRMPPTSLAISPPITVVAMADHPTPPSPSQESEAPSSTSIMTETIISSADNQASSPTNHRANSPAGNRLVLENSQDELNFATLVDLASADLWRPQLFDLGPIDQDQPATIINTNDPSITVTNAPSSAVLLSVKVRDMGALVSDLENLRHARMRHTTELADGNPPFGPLPRTFTLPCLHRVASDDLIDKLNGIMRGCAAAISRAIITAEERAEEKIIEEMSALFGSDIWSVDEMEAIKFYRDIRKNRPKRYKEKAKEPLSFFSKVKPGDRCIQPHPAALAANTTGQRQAKTKPAVEKKAVEPPVPVTEKKKKKGKKGKKNKNASPSEVQGNGQGPLTSSGLAAQAQNAPLPPAQVAPAPPVQASPARPKVTSGQNQAKKSSSNNQSKQTSNHHQTGSTNRDQVTSNGRFRKEKVYERSGHLQAHQTEQDQRRNKGVHRHEQQKSQYTGQAHHRTHQDQNRQQSAQADRRPIRHPNFYVFRNQNEEREAWHQYLNSKYYHLLAEERGRPWLGQDQESGRLTVEPSNRTVERGSSGNGSSSRSNRGVNWRN